jgi:hypothetical protein
MLASRKSNNNTEQKNEELPLSLFIKTVLLYVAGLGFSISVLVLICEFSCKIFQQVFYITLILPLLIVGFIVIKLGSKASLEYKNKSLKATFTGIAAFVTFLLLVGTFRIDPPKCCENNTQQTIIQGDTTKKDEIPKIVEKPKSTTTEKAPSYKGKVIVISGKVSFNEKPIENAVVKVEGTNLKTTTDKYGNFSFNYVPQKTDNEQTQIRINASFNENEDVFEGFDFTYVFTHNPMNITLSKK